MNKRGSIFLVLVLFISIPTISRSQCVDGDCQNGQGTYVYTDSSQYTGEWLNGRKHGHGTFTYADGRKYEGEWKKGMRDGQGKVFDGKGVEVKSGYWKNGMFRGEKE